MNKQIPQPKNWQDFEDLCMKLWGEIWHCSDTITKNGRVGQPQKGVDIYGIPRGKNVYHGIQCKCKSVGKNLTKEEIDDEIEKAKNFKPKLGRFIFTTTASKDVNIEEHIRIKNVENTENRLFKIYIFFWEDITHLLNEHPSILNWYMNGKWLGTPDVKVTFDGKDTLKIFPRYLKSKSKQSKDVTSESNERKIIISPFAQPCSLQFVNISPNPYECIFKNVLNESKWCDIYIRIENTSDTTINNYTLNISFENGKIEELCVGMESFSYLLNSDEDNQNREDDYFNAYKTGDNSIKYSSKDPLIKSDKTGFSFYLKPYDGVKEINVNWEIKADNFQKHGKLLIKVSYS